MVQPTSLDAYRAVKPTINRRQQQILRVFSNRSVFTNWTNREIADELGWDACQVTPRVGELRKKMVLEYDCTRKCTVTGYRAMAWRLRR